MANNINRRPLHASEARASVPPDQRARLARRLAGYLHALGLDRFEVGSALGALGGSLVDLARAMGALERAGCARFMTGARPWIRYRLASPPPRRDVAAPAMRQGATQ